MMGKYLLQEIKSGWRVPSIFAVVSVCLTVVAAVEMYFLINSDIMYEAPGVIQTVLILFQVMYFGFLVIANLIVLYYIPVRFYRQSYSDVGYLTHSLPVSKPAILGAHVLSGALWMLVMFAVDVFAFFLIGSGVGGAEFLRSRFEFVFGALWRELRSFVRVAGAPSVLLMLIGILAAVVSPFVTALQSCCAVSLGQMFEKHRVAGAVLMYFVLNFIVGLVNQTVFGVFTVFGDYRAAYNRPQQMVWYLIVGGAILLLIQIVECVVFFLISVNRMTKKLNLE